MTKYVHIDMKGGPPTLTYLLELLEIMSEWGAEGVVVEWEDMFPWSGDLSVLARRGHYTLEMVSSLLDHAARLHLKVIPLIQTFGHMEFVLKHEKFRHLRQIATVPNCVRPLSLDDGEWGGAEPAGRDGEAGDGGPPRPLLSPHRV